VLVRRMELCWCIATTRGTFCVFPTVITGTRLQDLFGVGYGFLSQYLAQHNSYVWLSVSVAELHHFDMTLVLGENFVAKLRLRPGSDPTIKQRQHSFWCLAGNFGSFCKLSNNCCPSIWHVHFGYGFKGFYIEPKFV
jgi:hypothetical protein